MTVFTGSGLGRPRALRRRDRRKDHALERSLRDRADVLVGDAALAIDDEGLRHAVDAPFDRGASVAVDADGGEGIAVKAKEAPRRSRLVLVIDPKELDARPLFERHEKRALLRARDAPRAPETDDRH